MLNLMILAGVPGSGKSTWATRLFDLKYSVVSTDAIRDRMFGSIAAGHEGNVEVNNADVFERFHREIRERLDHGVDVIADATSLTSSSRMDLLNDADDSNARVHLVVFTDVPTAFQRNAERDNRVPPDAMEKFATRMSETLRTLCRGEAALYDSVTYISGTS